MGKIVVRKRLAGLLASEKNFKSVKKKFPSQSSDVEGQCEDNFDLKEEKMKAEYLRSLKKGGSSIPIGEKNLWRWIE